MAVQTEDKEPEIKWEDLRNNTIFLPGECIKKPGDNLDCYIIIQADKINLELYNVFSGKRVSKFIKDIKKEKYKKISINSIVYKWLSKNNPMSPLPYRSSGSSLNNIVMDYAVQICNNVLRRRGKQNISYFDYPAIVVAAKPFRDTTKYKELTNTVVVSSNYDWNESSWNIKFLNLLKDNNVELGSQHPEITNTSNTFGNCAEQHAVNDLLSRYPDINVKNIEFSKAIRPRTGEIRPYCQNCKLLFKRLK